SGEITRTSPAREMIRSTDRPPARMHAPFAIPSDSASSARLKRRIPQELECRAVEAVAARFDVGVENGAAVAAPYRLGAVRSFLECLDPVYRRTYDERLRDHLRLVHSVQQKLIAAFAGAVGEQRGTARPQFIGALAGMDGAGLGIAETRDSGCEC